MEKALFQLKFTAKTLERQSKRCNKEETSEQNKLKKAIQQGNTEGARIFASNAIRKKNEALNLLRLSARVDAAASRIQTAVTMRQVTGNMVSVVKGMDRALESLNLAKISVVMDKFEHQFESLDAQAGGVQSAVGGAALQVPQDEIDLLMQKVADEANIELGQELQSAVPATSFPETPMGENDDLEKRLANLRNS